MRARFTLVALGLALAATAWAQGGILLMKDWSKQPVGAKGIPEGWKGQNWGSAKYDFTIVSDDGRSSQATFRAHPPIEPPRDSAPFCGVDRGVLLWGVMPPRQARGQPLHPIYALTWDFRSSRSTRSIAAAAT